eukprot:8707214-Karenia_brevis.AAC.1
MSYWEAKNQEKDDRTTENHLKVSQVYRDNGKDAKIEEQSRCSMGARAGAGVGEFTRPGDDRTWT